MTIAEIVDTDDQETIRFIEGNFTVQDIIKISNDLIERDNNEDRDLGLEFRSIDELIEVITSKGFTVHTVDIVRIGF